MYAKFCGRIHFGSTTRLIVRRSSLGFSEAKWFRSLNTPRTHRCHSKPVLALKITPRHILREGQLAASGLASYIACFLLLEYDCAIFLRLCLAMFGQSTTGNYFKFIQELEASRHCSAYVIKLSRFYC